VGRVTVSLRKSMIFMNRKGYTVTMRAVLVGAGGMGRTWAKNLKNHPDVEIVAWVDVVSGQAQNSAQELNLHTNCYESLKEALAETHADFVVDVTIPDAHETVTLTALQHGLPVLGEKPMTTSMASAKRMISASEAAGKLYMVSQSRRYDGRQSAFKQLVGDLGNVGVINADFYIGAHFGGFRDKMQNVLILDMAIHTFDQAREITGLDPVSVYAEEFNPSWSWYETGSSANCLFEMSNGAKFNYRGSWSADGLHTSWESDWRVIGQHGTARWDGHDSIEAQYVDSRAGTDFHLPTRTVRVDAHQVKHGIEGSLEDFLHALRSGDTPRGECHDNIKSLAMVLGAIESSKRGERVMIAEMMA
jgi:predicted dehydrogenase